jgi:hypothetical protein
VGGTGASETIPFTTTTFQLGDIGNGIVVSAGKIWITGVTASTDFQVPGTVTPAFQSTNMAATAQGPIGSANLLARLFDHA